MTKSITFKNLLLIALVIGYTYFVYNKGVQDTQARRRAYYKSLANAQAISSQREWASKINSSIISLAFERGLAFINN